MKKIGIIGLGIMGSGMVSNFLKHGYRVFVWNRTESVAKTFAQKGAIVCKTPADVARASDIVFEVTANDESSKSVWTGKNCILEGADADTILVASATLSIDWIDELISICKKAGFPFMDIALTGSRIGAETGTMTLLCGGDKKILAEIEPALQAVSKKIFHFGNAGQGMRYKLILNFLQAVHVVGFGQCMRIAKAYDMDLVKVAEALADRPGGAITAVAQQGYFKEPDPVAFSIEWILKDLTYAKKLANKLDVGLLDEVLSVYKKAMKKGHSKRNWTSVNTLD